MVNLNNFVLDCGELKSTPEVKMGKAWYDTDTLYFRFANSDLKTTTRTIMNDDLNEIKIETENKFYVEPSRKFVAWKRKCFYESSLGGMIPNLEYGFEPHSNAWEEVCLKYFSKQEMMDYLGVIPFTPSVMINISPDWKSVKDKLSNRTKIVRLKTIIENYLKESDRYDYYSYVIENGEGGDHIHAHIVAHINPNLHKSVSTHLAKGNHTQQLRKYAKKFKGMEGIIKGVSVQKTFLRTEELVKDKLDYLIEDKKPEGHKNKSVIEPGRVDKVLITVK